MVKVKKSRKKVLTREGECGNINKLSHRDSAKEKNLKEFEKSAWQSEREVI